jgi:hypothetical protein
MSNFLFVFSRVVIAFCLLTPAAYGMEGERCEHCKTVPLTVTSIHTIKYPDVTSKCLKFHLTQLTELDQAEKFTVDELVPLTNITSMSFRFDNPNNKFTIKDINRLENLTQLGIHYCNDPVFPHLPLKLKTLVLGQESDLTLSSLNPTLTTLAIMHMGDGSPKVTLSSEKEESNITSLYLWNVQMEDPSQKLSDSFPNLKTLELSFVKNVSKEDLNCLAGLTSLSLSTIADDFLSEDLRNLTGLTSLSLGGTQDFSFSLKPFVNLRQLMLSSNSQRVSLEDVKDLKKLVAGKVEESNSSSNFPDFERITNGQLQEIIKRNKSEMKERFLSQFLLLQSFFQRQ